VDRDREADGHGLGHVVDAEDGARDALEHAEESRRGRDRHAEGRDGLEHKPSEYADNGKDMRGPRVPEAPVFVPGLVTKAEEVLGHISALPAKPLTFVTTGIGRPKEIRLVPLYRIVDENYTVYWRLFDEAGWKKFYAQAAPKEAQRKAAEERVIDAVWSGSTKMEAEHAVEANSAPLVSSRLNLFHDATHGRISWKLKATPNDPMDLRVGFLGGNAAAFVVTIDGVKLLESAPAAGAVATTSSTTVKTYPISPELTNGKSTIDVAFTGQDAAGPAQIVFCELSRAIR